jgi:hypothetical protein
MRTGLLALCLLVPLPLLAWGDLGHRITASVAERQLGKNSPELKAALKMLKKQHLADVAVDADALRNQLGTSHTAEWHFVDIPLSSSSFDPARDCALSDCVIARIDEFRKILADPKEKPLRRQEALLYLIHFVGDLHQPMHCEGDDRGGNDLHVTFDGGGHVPGNDKGNKKSDNLHFVWDVSLLAWQELGEQSYVKHLFDDTLNGRDPATLAGGTTLDWAMESHTAAQGAQVPNGKDLDAAYFDTNAEVADERLLLGGLRLARVIKDALKQSP